ncbi:MAG TPA: DNA repair protein RecN [Gemmatimonadaceae bacterium]|nr:DNA repair protein RecN [Gemmatimonadaceae bacterium]
MLTELRIRNFAIIESLALPLVSGFNVLTGETGAGKSIIVGALGFLLGERAGSDVVRTGADKAVVEGVFDSADRPALSALLDERGLEADGGVVILRREVHGSGRTRAWLNDTATTAATLGEVGRMMVSLHGQHEAQTLIDPESQKRILDEFGGAGELASAVAESHAAWRAITTEIDALTNRRAEIEKRADYLRHVVSEIDDARLREGEEELIEEEARRLGHAEELRELATAAAAELEGSEHAILNRLGGIARSVSRLEQLDSSASRLRELCETAYYALEELARDSAAYAHHIDLDPARLAEVERRKNLLFHLTRKYGATIRHVMEAGQAAQAELDIVEGGHFDLRVLEGRRAEIQSRLLADSRALTARRTEAGDRLARDVEALLPQLGMPDGRFLVQLLPREKVAATGAEDVEFLVSLNVGHEPRSLARVASGGELSRVMLALKTIVARLDHTPTLVFDEIDAGIGGRVGLQIGDAMRALATHHQVLAISHLPQIAARAHHHIVVAKSASSGITAADTHCVEGEARVTEIARMLGGDTESKLGRAHAGELLNAASTPPVAPKRRTRR